MLSEIFSFKNKLSDVIAELKTLNENKSVEELSIEPIIELLEKEKAKLILIEERIDEVDSDVEFEIVNDIEIDTEDINIVKKQENPVERKEIYQIKNGMVGKVYKVDLNQTINLESDSVIKELIGLKEIGLTYDSQEQLLVGKPEIAGEFDFDLHTIDDNGILESYTMRIFINPDPRSLWKTLEPNKDDPFPKDHYDYQNIDFHNFEFYGGSLRGRSHAHQGTFRDDDFHMESISEDLLFLVVSDGAGSCKYSREGSRIVCHEAASLIKDFHDDEINEFVNLANAYRADRSNIDKLEALDTVADELIFRIVKRVIDSIKKSCAEHDNEIGDYSTTLLLTMIFKIHQEFVILSFAIGDGIIAKINNNIQLLSDPDSGQYAGQTKFITTPNIEIEVSKRKNITFHNSLNGLYLMTDGISDAYFETDANLEKKELWEKLGADLTNQLNFSSNNVQDEMKEWLNFWSPGNHDDRTIIFSKNDNFEQDD